MLGPELESPEITTNALNPRALSPLIKCTFSIIHSLSPVPLEAPDCPLVALVCISLVISNADFSFCPVASGCLSIFLSETSIQIALLF